MIGRLTIRRKATSTLLCEPAVVYDVLSDYGTYAEWMPIVRSSQVMSRETNFAIIDLEFSASPAKKVTLECLHAPTQMVISRSLLGSSPAMKLEWRITSPEPGKSEVTLTVTGPLFYLFLLGGYSKLMSPRTTLRALGAQAATFGSNAPAGEVLIEITESEEGLMCTYKGKRYKMEATA
ncbi:MAG TPA: SRPBCC family protein [Bryobacteraceae bacterium]|nr:SRPBCC family protein [Bryobacteraceae bacterium]